jgi:hypothetical protein
MTDTFGWRDSVAEYDRHVLSRNARLHRFVGAAVLCIGFACAWTLWTNLAGSGGDQIVEREPLAETPSSTHAKLPPRAVAYAKLAAALKGTRRGAASLILASLFDSRPLGFPPGTFARFAAVEDDSSAPASGPTAAKARDGSAASSRSDRALSPGQQAALAHRRNASLDAMHASPTVMPASAERPTIFERLFGKSSSSALAYAAPEDDGLRLGQGIAASGYDRWTAIYDISAHIVYLPDGTRLEAHSGLGARLDDARHTDERMRGATPVAVYDLQPRESLFHGVQALRLIPLDEAKVFGRTGLLAHTYMLGSNGQSNGCVSFRNYEAFLRAYQNGEIKRLAVVSQLD